MDTPTLTALDGQDRHAALETQVTGALGTAAQDTGTGGRTMGHVPLIAFEHGVSGKKRPMHADAEPPPPPAEEWRPVEGFPGYEMSSLGRVKGKRVPFLRPAVVGGYPLVTLHAPGRRRTFKLHALVCAVFHGPRPPGREAAHLNGVRADCRAGNLAWALPAENAHHKREHKTWPAGEANPAAKITAAQARAIRTEYAALPRRACSRVPRGARVEITGRYGVSRWLVTKIANRSLWKSA